MNMRQKRISRTGQALPVKALLVLLLTLSVVTTIPLALAKYSGEGKVSSSATVAKWDIKLSQDIQDNTMLTMFANGSTRITTITNGPLTKTFKIKNNSEVMAEITLRVNYVNSDGQKGTITASTAQATVNNANEGIASITAAGTGVTTQTANEVFRLEPNSEATFTITFKGVTLSGSAASTASSNYIRWYKVYFKAVQVD